MEGQQSSLALHLRLVTALPGSPRCSPSFLSAVKQVTYQALQVRPLCVAQGFLTVVLHLCWSSACSLRLCPVPLHPSTAQSSSCKTCLSLSDSSYATWAECLQALAGLHDHRTFHGDIKPNNLMVDMGPDGTGVLATLIDFGSAAVFGTGGPSLTASFAAA